MRHVIYLLLVINLLYLGWNLSHDAGGTDRTAGWPPIPDTVMQLMTLQEAQRHSNTTAGAGESRKPGRAETGPAQIDPERLTRIEPPGAGSPGCQAIGPFSVQADLGVIAGQLDELGLAPRERLVTMSESGSYRVYLPAQPAAATRRAVTLLQEQDDSDYYLERDRQLTLGIYNDAAGARERLESIRLLGLEPVLERRNIERDSWWLEFNRPARQVLQRIGQQYPDLELYQVACL